MSTVTENAGPRKIRDGRSLIEELAEYPAGELVKTIETGKKYICHGTEMHFAMFLIRASNDWLYQVDVIITCA